MVCEDTDHGVLDAKNYISLLALLTDLFYAKGKIMLI